MISVIALLFAIPAWSAELTSPLCAFDLDPGILRRILQSYPDSSLPPVNLKEKESTVTKVAMLKSDKMSLWYRFPRRHWFSSYAPADRAPQGDLRAVMLILDSGSKNTSSFFGYQLINRSLLLAPGVARFSHAVDGINEELALMNEPPIPVRFQAASEEYLAAEAYDEAGAEGIVPFATEGPVEAHDHLHRGSIFTPPPYVKQHRLQSRWIRSWVAFVRRMDPEFYGGVFFQQALRSIRSANSSKWDSGTANLTSNLGIYYDPLWSEALQKSGHSPQAISDWLKNGVFQTLEKLTLENTPPKLTLRVMKPELFDPLKPLPEVDTANVIRLRELEAAHRLERESDPPSEEADWNFIHPPLDQDGTFNLVLRRIRTIQKAIDRIRARG